MRRRATTIALTFGAVLLLAGTSFAVSKMRPGDARAKTP